MSYGATIHRGSLPKSLDRLVNKIIANRARKIPAIWRKMVNVYSSDNSFERTTSFDPTGYVKEKPEGTPVQFDRPTQSYSKDFVHKTYALAGAITQEALSDKRSAEMVAVPEMLADSAAHSINAQVADLVVNGFTTTYHTAGDGVAIFSASHRHPNDRTFSSVLSAQVISPSAIESAILQIRQQTNSRAQPLFLGYGTFYLFYATSQTARVVETLKTLQMPYTADNTVNWVAQQKIIPIEVNYFTGNEWMIQDADNHDFTYYNRMNLTASREGSWETGDVMWKIVYRNSVGVNRALGFVGCQGA